MIYSENNISGICNARQETDSVFAIFGVGPVGRGRKVATRPEEERRGKRGTKIFILRGRGWNLITRVSRASFMSEIMPDVDVFFFASFASLLIVFESGSTCKNIHYLRDDIHEWANAKFSTWNSENFVDSIKFDAIHFVTDFNTDERCL